MKADSGGRDPAPATPEYLRRTEGARFKPEEMAAISLCVVRLEDSYAARRALLR